MKKRLRNNCFKPWETAVGFQYSNFPLKSSANLFGALVDSGREKYHFKILSHVDHLARCFYI